MKGHYKNDSRSGILAALCLAALCASFPLAGCRKQTASPATQPAAGQSAAAPAAPAGPLPTQGTISIVDGAVQVKTGTAWANAEIGTGITEASIVKTGPKSGCEIQLGELGTVRLSENTVLSMNRLFEDKGQHSAELGLAEGSVVCKVRKLAGAERFQVRTKTAVAGVRGTCFLVSCEKDRDTLVAVKEGSVAILAPTSDALNPKLAAVPEAARPGVEAVLASVNEGSPLLKAGEEIRLKPLSAAQLAKVDAVETALAAVVASAEAASQSSTLPARAPDLDALKAALREFGESRRATPQKSAGKMREPTAARFDLAPEAAPDARPVSGTESRGPLTCKVSSASPVAGLSSNGSTLFVADSKSRIAAFTDAGKLLWLSPTDNGINNNSIPVTTKGIVLFQGDRTLAALAASSGKPLWSIPLGNSASGLFGRRPAVGAGKIFISTDSGLAAYNLETGESEGNLAIADGSDMTPLFRDGHVYLVSKAGTFCAVNAANLTVEFQVPTQALQPVAATVAIEGDRAIFSGRKGTAACVSLSSRSLVWQKNIADGKSVEVFTDPLVQGSAAYFYAKGSLYALALSSGESLFAPLDGLSAPACFSQNGTLIAGTKGMEILELNPHSGAIIRKAAVAAKAAGSGYATASGTAVPLGNGEVVFWK